MNKPTIRRRCFLCPNKEYKTPIQKSCMAFHKCVVLHMSFIYNDVSYLANEKSCIGFQKTRRFVNYGSTFVNYEKMMMYQTLLYVPTTSLVMTT